VRTRIVPDELAAAQPLGHNTGGFSPYFIPAPSIDGQSQTTQD
jgi:hypothetical protein